MYTKKTIGVIAAIMFIAGVLFAAKLGWIGDSKAKEYFHEAKGAVLPTAVAPGSFAELTKRVSPAVVNISTTKKVNVRGFNPFGRRSPGGSQDPFEDFFNKFFEGAPEQPQSREQHSLGSGFVINEEGYILTNNHVVAEADEIVVRLNDEHKYPAKLIGTDEKTDMAVIKVKVEKLLPYVQLGDSDKAQIGDWVVAIGNPFGLDHTVTAGIISAKGRVIGAGPYDNFIQTDASINPGNSGGPLFNTAGEVVGINTAIFMAGQGLGFAIPINMAKKILPQLIEKGKIVNRGYLGLYVQPLSDELVKSFNLPNSNGALVGDVIKGSPADQAGLKRGDVILKYDDHEIQKAKELPGLVSGTESGKTVRIEFLRDGKKQFVDITLGTSPTEGKEGTPSEESAQKAEKQPDVLGLVVKPLDNHMNRGVVITSVRPDSAAEDADVRVGDILLEVNGKPITSTADYDKTVSGVKKGSLVRLLLSRRDASLFVAFTVR